MKTLALIFCSLVIIISSRARAKTSLRIFSYNLQNLFDTVHTFDGDVEKNDWRYLPLSSCDNEAPEKCGAHDWTEKKLEKKMKQIHDVFRWHQKAVGDKDFPEIVGFSEVETPLVAKKLARVLGYKSFVMTESNHHRGIDVALFFRPSRDLKYISHRQVFIEKVTKETRPILEVQFKVRGRDLFTYVNHWPSQRNPNSDRVKAARVLRSLIEERQAQNPSASFLAMGDFNTKISDKSLPHPLRDVLMRSSNLVDVHKEYKKSDQPAGTYYFPRKNQWQILDRFFVSKDMKKKRGIEIDTTSYLIFGPKELSRAVQNGSQKVLAPWRYDHDLKTGNPGYSDHYPISLKLLVR